MSRQSSETTREEEGRSTAPAGVGPKELGQVFVQSGKEMTHDNAPQWAAAIAYYSLLSLFPLLLAMVAIAAYFVDQQWVIERATQWLGQYLPRGAVEIEGVIQEAIEARGSVGLLSILALLWSGTRVFGVMTMALNIAYDVDESYGFFKRLLIEIMPWLPCYLFSLAPSLSATCGASPTTTSSTVRWPSLSLWCSGPGLWPSFCCSVVKRLRIRRRW